MMECAICEKEVCQHGSVLYRGHSGHTISKCHYCGAVGDQNGPPVYGLPFYEGKVDFSSDCGAVVCPDCYKKYVDEEFNEVVAKYYG